LFLFKVLKNEKVIHIGIREEMNLPTDSMKNLKWWKEKDKLVYTLIGCDYTANFYKKVFNSLYKLESTEYNAKEIKIHDGSIIDNFKYKVFYDAKDYAHLDESLKAKREENIKRIEMLEKKKKKILKFIETASLNPKINKDMRLIPLHSNFYPKSNKSTIIAELRKFLIVVPKEYSLKGIREIKRLYLKITEEKYMTTIRQQDIDDLVKQYGNFDLVKIKGDECERQNCHYSPLFKTPAFYINSFNKEASKEIFGFELYSRENYFSRIYHRLYCHECTPDVIRAYEKAEMEEKKRIIRKNNHGIEMHDKEFWKIMILELDYELKEAVGAHLSNIYINLKNNLPSAIQSIKILYDLGFAQKIPYYLKKDKKFIPGIYYVGDYYYERTLSEEFKRLKDFKADEWY